MDDTLWPVGPVIAAAESTLLAWLRTRYPRTVSGHDIESMRVLRAAVAERFPQHAHDLTFLRHRALKDLFGAAGHAEDLADEALEVFLAERNRVNLYEDVRPALLRLGARYRLFALSNGNAELARCGIADLFAGHVTARGAGVAKPDARIFRAPSSAGLASSGGTCCTSATIHAADVAGAMQAGMQAVWLNRDARDWPMAFLRRRRAPFRRSWRSISTNEMRQH